MNDIKRKNRVSFSQYSNWDKCEYKWFLDYAKGLRQFEDSLNTCFGTAIHKAIQTYLKSLYTDGLEVSDSIDVNAIFKKAFDVELQKMTQDGKPTYTEDDYKEFSYDGDDILKAFLNSTNRLKHFPRQKYELVGIEIPVEMDIKNNVSFIAYIDLILREKTTGIYKIFDFKTSTMGWNKYEREDETKLSQLLLYKAFYSKAFNVPLEKIDVEFFILKRKLYENVAFPQSRIQRIIPIQNKKFISKTINNFVGFLDKCFNLDGTYKLDETYHKNPGKNRKNCKYCSHYKVRCDGKED
jgi:hypothetical protein